MDSNKTFELDDKDEYIVNDNFVIAFTGPGIFTKAIYSFFGL